MGVMLKTLEITKDTYDKSWDFVETLLEEAYLDRYFRDYTIKKEDLITLEESLKNIEVVAKARNTTALYESSYRKIMQRLQLLDKYWYDIVDSYGVQNLLFYWVSQEEKILSNCNSLEDSRTYLENLDFIVDSIVSCYNELLYDNIRV